MSDLHKVFALWNYSFLLLTISIHCVFLVDLIGHKTKTISATVFSMAVVLAVLIGELCLSFGPFFDHNIQLTTAIILTIIVSIIVPIKYRLVDLVVTKRARKFGVTGE
tara:strand:+ start:456 stop:779 length:324 start_codon:yes stop_codon:yes gene_type:complete